MSFQSSEPFPREDQGLPSASQGDSINASSSYEVCLSNPKRPSKPKKQTSLFSYLPLEFQTRYDNKEDKPIDEEWGNSYREKSKSTVRV